MSLQQPQFDHTAAQVLAAYGLRGAELSRIPAGLINKTYLVRSDAARFVLQWVNPIFGPEVHDDIEAVTSHVERAGIVTPRLVRTRAGELWTRDAEGGVWRLLTYVDGEMFERATSAKQCLEAARLVGRFHKAASTLDYTFKHQRLGVHDTPRHLAKLRDALVTEAGHARYADVRPIAVEILERAAALPPLHELPKRVVHGDLKLSNIMFGADGRAVALVDLDTVARMPLPVELGDAWRSWCNPRGEDDPAACLEMPHLDAALEGYAESARGLLTKEEREALPEAIEMIALELAARFCADALLESYFGWDATRFASQSEHNLVRARSQLSLARSLARARPRISELVARRL